MSFRFFDSKCIFYNKRNKENLRYYVVILTVLIASCSSGGGGSSNGNFAQSDLSDSPILGRWMSPCDASSGALSFSRVLEFFEDGTFTQTVSGFFDLSCSQPGFDATTSGIVSESETMELPDRGIVRNINFITEAYSIIPRSADSVLFFNTQVTCGINNWEIGVDFDISSCTNRPGDDTSRRPTPYADFSIYLVERGQLFYGNELSFTSENRPNTLAPRPAYIRPDGAIGDEFPSSFKRVWVLPENTQYVEFLDQGLVRFYSLTADGCYGFNFLTLFSDGVNRYQDPFKVFTFEIVEQNNTLEVTNVISDADTQVLVYSPSDISIDQLALCG
ncbi:MAG: hypothetical protein AB8B87_22035 [Granulosicoccus sp.]